MIADVPEFIKKGGRVKYKGEIVFVADWYFTCPCAIGEKDHFPTDDLLMIKFSDGRQAPVFEVESV